MKQAPDTFARRSRLAAAVRRLGRGLAAAAAVLIITTAILVGLGRVLIGHVDELRPWVEQQLSARLGTAVSIERVEGRWPRLTPTIILHRLRTGSAAQPWLEVGQARLEFKLPDLLRAGRNPLRLVAVGLDLALIEQEDGSWGLTLERGGRFDPQTTDAGTLAGDVLIRDARLRVRPRGQPEIGLLLDDAEVLRRGSRTGLLASARLMQAPDARLELALEAGHPQAVIRSLAGRVEVRRLRPARSDLISLLPDVVHLPDDRIELDAGFQWQAGSGGRARLELRIDGSDGLDLSAKLLAESLNDRTDIEVRRMEANGHSLMESVVLAKTGRDWGLSVPELDLAPLHALASRWLSGWSNWPVTLAGQIENLEARYRLPISLGKLSGQIHGLEFALPGDRAGLSGLDLELGLSGDRAAVSLSGAPTLDWPAKMRQAIPVDRVSGRVILMPSAIKLDDIRALRPEAEARANGWVWLGAGRPFLDFLVEADRIDAVDPRPWLPAGQIPPQAMEWLDHALLGLDSGLGGINYHVRLGRPFRAWQPGDFQAWVEFDGAELDFWADWPRATGLAGRVDFVGRTLRAHIERGLLGTVPVSAERVMIENLSNPVIDLRIQADSQRAGQVQALVAGFPLAGWERYFEPVELAGELSLQIDLVLPIRRIADWSINGRAELAGVDIGIPAAGLVLPGLHGGLEFDRDRIHPAPLELDGSQLVIEAGFGQPAWLELVGEVALADVLAGPAAQAIKHRLVGASRWQARLAGLAAGGWQLAVRSGLEGTELRLPAPLSKPAAAELALQLQVDAGDDGLDVAVQIGEILRLKARSQAERWRLALGLDQAAPALPERAGFVIDGHLAELDLGEWISLSSRFAALPGQADPRGRVRLVLDRLNYADLTLEHVELELQRRSDDWYAQLSGASVSGTVSVPMPLDSGRVATVDLERLHFSPVDTGDPSAELELAPVPAQTRTRVPTQVPPLHLLIEDLIFRGLHLGRVRIESHRRADGIEFEQIEVAGPYLEVAGRGRWIESGSGPVTELDARLISDRLPALLAAFGYQSELNAARTQLELNGRWPGAPGDFLLARLDGHLHLLALDGTIPEARPGAGRLLGLVSFSAVPRRLMLDFRDVFAQGLKFDRVSGTFSLSAGTADTDDVRIEAPAAEILISGSTDLGARRYDQLIVVRPEVSNTLPVIGGLAGGPVGAAAGLILRSLLEQSLQGIAEARYRITGPWESPTVELLETRPAEPGPPESSGQTD